MSNCSGRFAIPVRQKFMNSILFAPSIISSVPRCGVFLNRLRAVRPGGRRGPATTSRRRTLRLCGTLSLGLIEARESRRTLPHGSGANSSQHQLPRLSAAFRGRTKTTPQFSRKSFQDMSDHCGRGTWTTCHTKSLVSVFAIFISLFAAALRRPLPEENG